jgi:GTP-binding protein
VFFADPSIHDLANLQRRRSIEARKGGNGRGQRKHGADGETVEVRMPVGTQVFDAGELVADLAQPHARVVIARGGPGGRGNARFVSSTRQVPRFAEVGMPGDERDVELHLKLLADAALVGLPNAGKSSLISRISNARPKVADYPFTTLQPNLGVVRIETDKSFVIADIPGLIEGAAEGAGLGIQFLKHVARTRLLLHVVDIAPFGTLDPVEQIRAIEGELKRFDPKLLKRPRWLVFNKADLLPPEERQATAKAIVKKLRWKHPWYLISAIAREGTWPLALDIQRFFDEQKRAALEAEA